MLFSTRDSDPGQDEGTWTHTLKQECEGQDVSTETVEEVRNSYSTEMSSAAAAETSFDTLLFLSQVIGCTRLNCSCECFKPGRVSLRSCDRCQHGWVAHAVSKLGAGALQQCSGQVEIVQCSVVFDISTLLLYGTQAVPVRMKILLDRLFSVLTHTQVITILHTLGWTLRDYVRGYILQDSMGKVLDRWVIMTPEDELVTLQQFLRFGETKSIVELMAVQEQQDRLGMVSRTGKTDSDIRQFIESSGQHHSSVQIKTRTGAETPPSLHHFENLPGGNMAFLLPFPYGGQSVASPLVPSSSLVQEPCRGQQTSLDKPGQGPEDSAAVTTSRGSKIPVSTDGIIREIDYAFSKTSSKSQTTIEPTASSAKDPCSSTSSSGLRERSLGLRKGRVSCSACGKTFYDKGTLKIHYNAVHLKIKHRCTIEGCNMVFSSLRSRNRHSANPNPRLHTPTLRGAHSPQPLQPRASILPSRVKPPVDGASLSVPCMSPSALEATHTPLVFQSVKAVQTVLPFSSAVLPSRSPSGANRSDNGVAVFDQPLKPHPISVSEDSGNPPRQGGGAPAPQPANQDRGTGLNDTAPKKKSRKSSMPVKINRETLIDPDLEVQTSGCTHGHSPRRTSIGYRTLSTRETSEGATETWMDHEGWERDVDEWRQRKGRGREERNRPLLKVKEEADDTSYGLELWGLNSWVSGGVVAMATAPFGPQRDVSMYSDQDEEGEKGDEEQGWVRVTSLYTS
ncbi:zinc finger protein basonuclin-2 [Hoplias malabaricus]|uniref:zinc finger protein basonuclin-2 n=1 Tax=Hoplias malabaricus TaxID=27720 RepID=UPI003461967E